MLSQTVALLSMYAYGFQEPPSAKSLIDNMLAHYHGAKTITGNIKLTVAAAQGSASLSTQLQYERPAKLYILQQKQVANPDPEFPSKWLVTSDGSMFSYSVPNDKFLAAPTLRLVEPVKNPRVKIEHTIATIYGASAKSIGDRSMPLDIAIAGRDDLVYRIAQWETREINGSKVIGGKNCWLVTGKYRPYAGAQAVGTYQMAITKEGDLLQYVEKQSVAADRGIQVEVVSQWDVNLTVDGKVDPALFKVIVK